MPGDSSLFDIPPPKFGRYRVQHQIGVGTTGPAFRAEDPETHTPIVIKSLRTYLPPDVNQMVVDDLIGIIARSPAHPCLVPSRAAGLEEDEPYYVSDLAPGESLDEALKRFGPGAIADVLPRVREVAQALDEAAERGFCHGALHPRDIIVSEDATAVTGVGVAEILGRRGAGVPIRRPYTAPEIGRGELPSAASDQFSLAAITYEWLFGNPISGPAYTPLEVPSLPGVESDALSDAFTTALASDSTARFADSQSFVNAIAAAVPANLQSTARRASARFTDVPLHTRSSAAAPAWDDEGEIDAPLILDGPPSDPTLVPSFSSSSMFGATGTPKRGFGMGALAATLFFGMTVGLGGGYLASTRLWPVSPSPSAPTPASRRPVPVEQLRSTEAAPAPSAAAPPTAAATDVPVTPLPALDTPTPRPTSRPPVAAITPVQSATVLPGSLVVDSRPPGAAVTINGVPRGRTPLSLDRVAPGDYIITMRLTDFRPMTVTVKVAAGERARAAASLTSLKP